MTWLSTGEPGSAPDRTEVAVDGRRERAGSLSRRAVLRQLEKLRHGAILLRDDCGSRYLGESSAEASPSPELRVHDRRFYRSLAIGGTVGAAESFIKGWWTTDDLVELLRLLVRNIELADEMEGGVTRIVGALARVGHWLRRNTRLGSRRNIHSHYDLGNDLFRLFLDETMTYSCGVFESPSSTMAEASLEKLTRICRKLRLGPSDHVLEIGTGWGSFAIHAAKSYGCRVTTTTISQEQHDLARERIEAEGISDRVTLLLEDYRDLRGRYDKLVSIEMIEAVGHEFLGTFFGTCSELLDRGGAMLLQAITMPDRRYERYRRSVDFVQKHIFPGCCVPSISAMNDAIARNGDLRVVGLDEIGIHYATTLRHWRRRFLERRDDVRSLGYAEEFIRLWEFYLAYCEAGFAERYTGDVHMLLAKPAWRQDDHVYPGSSH